MGGAGRKTRKDMKKSGRQTKRPILMQEIADMAGVSKSTVSRALAASPLISERTREEILTIARQKGYRLNKKARNFQSSSTLTIAVVVQEPDPTEWSFTDPFFLQLVGSIADELDKLGHELLLANIRIDIDEWVHRHIDRGRCDGAIILHNGYSHETINSIAGSHTPIVAWGGNSRISNTVPLVATIAMADTSQRITYWNWVDRKLRLLVNVTCRNWRCGDLAMSMLMRKVACPSWLNDRQCRCIQLGRRKCFRRLPGYRETRGCSRCRVRCRSPGVMRAVVKSGRTVPDDVAVVGYDDIRIARSMSPSLSTVRQDCRLGANHLVRKLMRLIDGGNVRSKVLAPELIVRESSSPTR